MSGYDAHGLSKSPQLIIEALGEDDHSEWDVFVRRHPQGTFFHLAAWSKVLRRAFGHQAHYLTAKRNGVIVGVLPLARVRSWLFGDALVSTPFCVYGGVLAESDEVGAALEQHAATMAESFGTDHLELRNKAKPTAGWPSKDLYVTFRKELNPDPGKNMEAIPRKQRAEVRAGLKKNSVIEFDKDSRRLFDIYSQSVRSLGTPVFSRNYFDVLMQEFGDDCEITTVVNQGAPVASLMTFWFRDEVLPYYGGGLPSARPLSAYDFLYWDLMRRASERGTRIYDFGRSKVDTGPYKYKKHWGFEPEPLPYSYHLVRRAQVPNLSPTNPKYRYVIEAWKHMPLALTRWFGPLVAPYLG